MNATRELSLSLPVVLYLDGILSVDAGEGLKAIGARFDGPNTFVCKSPVQSDFRDLPGWILESSGFFRELFPRKRRREWAKPMSFLFQLVQTEFQVSDPRSIFVGEMMERLATIRDKFLEAPVAADLRRHLAKYGKGEIVSGDILRAWPM